MKYKVFYISNHGFGHLTRCMAQVEKQLIKEDSDCVDENYKILMICGKGQIEFAKKYLAKYGDRIFYRELETDIGLINKEKSLEVDKVKLEKELRNFISSWDEVVNNEVETLKKLEIEEIYTDISPIGTLVGKALNKKIIGVSNFTWYLQYNHLNLSEDILEKYHEIDQLYDEFHAYPLHLDISHMKCRRKYIDFISRKIDDSKVENIKKKYGKSIFISCGKSASLEKIKIENFNGTIFCTPGIQIESNTGRVCELPLDIEDTHNYVAASELIISKAGWSTVSEAVCGKTQMLLMEREGVLEDTHIINELKKQGKATSIKENELRNVDYFEIRHRLSQIKI